jgi:pimeloyl-ACP methyl ester carboxylesterase
MSLGSAVALATERVVKPVEGMHRAISGRWFGTIGPVGEPVRLAHDAISSVVYTSIRIGGTALGIGLDMGMTVNQRSADSIQAFVNGLWGDDLGRHEESVGISMGIRDRQGAPVRIGPEIAAAFPEATGRLVVLVHGLVETERSWNGKDTGSGLSQAIDIHPALTPVSIRYNTGLRVSANGSELASLLDEVHRHWPVPVESIALVGHSMGGLVVRSAITAAREAGQHWVNQIDDVVTLGSPHRGTPLEKLVNVASWGLSKTPETRPLADFLNTRSVGIKDLRFGAIVDDDWVGVDPDALLDNTVGDHSLPPDVNTHFVAGVVTSDPAHPIGLIAGDLWVRAASGTGGEALEPTNVVVLGGVNHFDLCHDPTVIDHVMGWLASDR